MTHHWARTSSGWAPDEYAAGYRARLSATPNSEQASRCWCCGWEDADTEVLEAARHRRVLAEDGEDQYSDTWGLLLDAGRSARANGISFDEGWTKPWKEGWVDADIDLGMAG